MKPSNDNPNAARFVILFHQFPPGHEREDHWDLMLEDETDLLTWSLSSMLEPGTTASAVRLPNHRKAYLDYEGPVSGDRGWVTRVFSGEFFWESQSDPPKAILNGDGKRMAIEFQTNGDELWVIVA